MNTKMNLLRAFAGESQARMRYEMAAKVAKKQKLYILEDLFKFTANQEKQHAIVFYDFLKTVFKEEEVNIECASYPVDVKDDILYLLQKANQHEHDEAAKIYKEFGQEAKKEGYLDIASAFFMISDIEQFHEMRFKKYEDLLSGGKLFSGNPNDSWMCLNCGFIYEGANAPEKCPVCKHPQGYYERLHEVPFN